MTEDVRKKMMKCLKSALTKESKRTETGSRYEVTIYSKDETGQEKIVKVTVPERWSAVHEFLLNEV